MTPTRLQSEPSGALLTCVLEPALKKTPVPRDIGQFDKHTRSDSIGVARIEARLTYPTGFMARKR